MTAAAAQPVAETQPPAETAPPDYLIVHRIVDGRKQHCGRLDYDVYEQRGADLLRERWGPGEYALDYRINGVSGSAHREQQSIAAPVGYTPPMATQPALAPQPAAVAGPSPDVLQVMLAMFQAQQTTMGQLLAASLGQEKQRTPAAEIATLLDLAERMSDLKQPESVASGMVAETIAKLGAMMLDRKDQPVRNGQPRPRVVRVPAAAPPPLPDLPGVAPPVASTPPAGVATNGLSAFIDVLRCSADVTDRDQVLYAEMLVDLLGAQVGAVAAGGIDPATLAGQLLERFPDLAPQKLFVESVAVEFISMLHGADEHPAPSPDDDDSAEDTSRGSDDANPSGDAAPTDGAETSQSSAA